MTPVTKYWVCKIAPPLVYEAMECLGGNAYVEEGGFPLLYREVPVNAIWEGSGNVMCLDVLRAVERSPETLERVLAGIEAASGGEQRLKSAVDGVRILLGEAAGTRRGRDRWSSCSRSPRRAPCCRRMHRRR
jgi:putative acyl-CoA dehydrogenase